MLVFKAATAFTDEAYRTMYQAGAKMYKVPPGCGDKSCATPLTEEEAKNLKTSQDGNVHLSNNGIFNDLDGAIKYAQNHGGTINDDGSKNYSKKPENQYIIFAPKSNNVLSELLLVGVAKTGVTSTVGLTQVEHQTSRAIEQTTSQGQALVIDSHSRGTLTTDNAMQSLINKGGIKDDNGNTMTPNIQMNNYGSAQNLETGNKTLQQLTGNNDAQINSTIHTKDLVGTSAVSGNNPTTPVYNNTNADGTKAEIKAVDDGKSVVKNLINIVTGTATPHNCYGTSGAIQGCIDQWKGIPESNSPKITNPDYQSPIAIPEYSRIEKITSQAQKDSNVEMKQLLQPASNTSTSPTTQIKKIDRLQNFKKEK